MEWGEAMKVPESIVTDQDRRDTFSSGFPCMTETHLNIELLRF